jgi:glycosyltransferase involved in cell wall biosynthesis
MAVTGSPEVSVLMPARDAARWLAEAVESILAQTFASFELLVIDDGSTDDTARLLSRFAERDGRVKVLSGPARGLVAALNEGLAAARAPLIARLDADDIAHPERLAKQVAFLADHPDVGVVGSWAQEIDSRGRPLGLRAPETCPDRLSRLLARTNPLVHSSVMARTQLLRDLGGYRCAFEAAEDYDLWLRVADQARLANLSDVLVSYRIHDGSVSGCKLLRQGFSARLARRAAMTRRQAGRDPADSLTAPPDWHSPMSADAFYAEDAALYRWLDRVGRPEPSAPGGAGSLAAAWREGLADLSHSERRMAARALVDEITGKDRTQARGAASVLLELCRRQPALVLGAAWSLRR